MVKHDVIASISEAIHAMYGLLRLLCVIAVTAALCTLTTSAHAQTCDAISQGLVGYWKFDDGTGSSTAADSSGSGNTGTLTSMDNTNAWVPGQIGGALRFNSTGTNDRVVVADDASIQNLTTMTACAWVYPTQFGISQFPTLMSKVTPGLDDSWNFYINDQAGELIGFYDRHLVYRERGVVPVNTWTHICGTTNYTNTTAGVRTYKDGVLQTSGGGSGDFGGPGDDVGNSLFIGMAPDGNQQYRGIIDELMLFNRELSATEIEAIYNGQLSVISGEEGTIVFNEDHALMQYCDGTDWRMMGVGSYVPNAVQFNTDSDYLQADPDDLGFEDSNKFTMSVWARLDAIGNQASLLRSQPGRIDIGLSNADDFQFVFRDASASQLITADCSGVTAGQWYHFLISVDLSQDAVHCYTNDQDNLSIFSGPVNGVIDFATNPNFYRVGRHGTTGGQNWDGQIADLWLDVGTYIDLSVEANRRKFISASGMPMYLGEDGSIPTGVSPDIFLSGDTVDWHTNKGAGVGYRKWSINTKQFCNRKFSRNRYIVRLDRALDI